MRNTEGTTPQPPPLKRRGRNSRDAKAPSSSEEGVGGGGPSREWLLKRAAELRQNPPEPERRVWNAIRRRDLGGHKFRRQAVIGNRIVDFFCPAKALIVEIDGDTHDPDVDRGRDRAMSTEHGFATVRFTNHEVMSNLDGVLEHLAAILGGTPDRWCGAGTTPRPPPLKRRGRNSRDPKAPSSSEEGVGGGGVSQPRQVAAALRQAADLLAPTSDTARLDAELLMAHALGLTRSDMLLRHMADPVPGGFAGLVERRAWREPVAHILGSQEFRGLALEVTPDTLIPRGDSEVLVEAALECAAECVPGARRVLDLGTGSGALLLAVLSELPGAEGTGTDASPAALAVARRNAARLGLADRAQFTLRDWTAAGWADDLGRFDLVLCNPPYVEEDAALDPDVRDFEPAAALFAGPEGLDDYRCLLPQLAGLLAGGGVAVFEIGHRQAEAVAALAAAAGFASELRRDLAGRPRALVLTAASMEGVGAKGVGKADRTH